jgi:multisubunit Na+/H+ antiporter MnhG subunit
VDPGRRAGLRWTCGVIFLAGVALVAVGAWGLLRAPGRVALALGSATSIVFGAVLIVFAALLPWLADGPVRIGPLAVTLRIRGRSGPRRRPR